MAQKFENLMRKCVTKTIKEPKTEMEIPREIVEYAKYVNKVVSPRTVKKIESDKGEMGLLGQEIFNGMLLNLKVPNLYANPIYEECDVFRKMKGKHFDFCIPPIGHIGVKTTPEGSTYRRFLANVDRWKNEIHDIAVAIKIENLGSLKAYFSGWLYAKEVESLPTHEFKKGEGKAYWTYLNPDSALTCRNTEISGEASPRLKPLRPAKEFNIMLRDACRKMNCPSQILESALTGIG